MRRQLSLVLVLSLSMSAGVAAQGTLVYSQNKCAIDKQEQLHRGGDEWNVVLWYNAATIPAFLSAANELVSRVNQRHPTLFPQVTSWCTEHKDSFLALGKSTSPVMGAPRRP